MNDEPSDPDQAAILARRQRFIALALSSVAGLATAACRPQPCLSVAPEDTAAPPEQPETPDAPLEPDSPDAPGEPPNPPPVEEDPADPAKP